MLMESIKKSIIFVLVFISGCAVLGASDNQVKTSALQATPSHFSSGENVQLTFPKNHPNNLAIRNPSGIWYSIHNSDENVFILPSKEYKKITVLKLNTRVLDGVTWINGKKVKEKVFQKKGEYLIYMANNLETEPENTFHFMATVNLTK